MILSIDPGRYGALTIIDDKEFHSFHIPYDTNGIDMVELGKTFTYMHLHWDGSIIIEKQRAYRSMGIKALESFLVNYGKLVGYLESQFFNITFIEPTDWINYHYGSKRPKGYCKAWNISKAIQLYPDFNKRTIGENKGYLEGIADTILMYNYWKSKNEIKD